MAKRWTQKDETYLKRYADRKKVDELAERFKTDREAVKAKLEEMGLAAKDTLLPYNLAEDPHVKMLEKGLAALHKKQWSGAAKIFRQIVEETDITNVGLRARQYLKVCERHLEKDAAGTNADPFLAAVFERNRGNLEEALEICTRGGRQRKDDRFAYLAAAIHVLNGDLEQGHELLAHAVELDAKNRVHAFHDGDFAALREHAEYGSLFRSA